MLNSNIKTKIKDCIIYLQSLIPGYILISNLVELKHRFMPSKKKLGSCAKNAIIQYPVHFESPGSIFLEQNTRIREFCHIINSPWEKVIIKKYSVIASNCTIITNSHRSTVTIPQILLGGSHINDKSSNITIGEDVWVGANVTILPGANLGRGSIVAAGSLVTKPVPPYAVVAGAPAKIVARKFDYDDIIIHEEALYNPDERLSHEELNNIFDKYLFDKKTFGTNEGIDKEAKEKIKALKRYLNYIEPF